MSSSALRPRCVIATQMREVGFSGGQVHVAAVRRYLAEVGWNATLVTPFSGRGLLRKAVFGLRYALKHLSGELDVFWYRWGHQVYLRKALRRELERDEAPAVIYAQDPQSAQAALELRRPGKDKVVLIVHFNDSQAEEWVLRGLIQRNGWVYRGIAALEAEVLPRVDALVYVSAWMRDRLETRTPAIRAVPHAVIPNFVEAPEVDASVERRDLIAVGTLEPRKNQAYVLRVIAELASRGRSVSATLVGDGEDRAALERLAVELKIAAQVKFAGNIRGAARWIGAHRLLVHAAQLENCPIALIESLAAGVPVIAAKVGGIPEIVDRTTGGFWDLASVKTGADTVLALLDDEERHAAMAQRCRERYAAEFAPEVGGHKLATMFEGLLR
jgi:glycosyltransferase involved in cell wall biosynthesis